ncbi:GNAT family N-acetyltransferase [Streptomyces virginiae]|uniref:GNAT family N-acetyltransferase n=1 Tax=Streptomyces virginiae TaxID=1961 RepID=A0ABZ1TNM4_STRVG
MVATHPDHRRRGYARAAVSALLDHLDRVEDVTLFELHTSSEAAALYREFGFAGSPTLMRRTRRSQSATSSRWTGAGATSPPRYRALGRSSFAFATVHASYESPSGCAGRVGPRL